MKGLSGLFKLSALSLYGSLNKPTTELFVLKQNPTSVLPPINQRGQIAKLSELHELII